MKKRMTILTAFLMLGLAWALPLFAGTDEAAKGKAIDAVYTEAQRKAIYKELASAEARAADEVGPILDSGTVEDAMKEQERLQEKYRADVLQKYNLDHDQEVQLNFEGFTKHWGQE